MESGGIVAGAEVLAVSRTTSVDGRAAGFEPAVVGWGFALLSHGNTLDYSRPAADRQVPCTLIVSSEAEHKERERERERERKIAARHLGQHAPLSTPPTLGLIDAAVSAFVLIPRLLTSPAAR